MALMQTTQDGVPFGVEAVQGRGAALSRMAWSGGEPSCARPPAGTARSPSPTSRPAFAAPTRATAPAAAPRELLQCRRRPDPPRRPLAAWPSALCAGLPRGACRRVDPGRLQLARPRAPGRGGGAPAAAGSRNLREEQGPRDRSAGASGVSKRDVSRGGTGEGSRRPESSWGSRVVMASRPNAVPMSAGSSPRRRIARRDVSASSQRAPAIKFIGHSIATIRSVEYRPPPGRADSAKPGSETEAVRAISPKTRVGPIQVCTGNVLVARGLVARHRFLQIGMLLAGQEAHLVECREALLGHRQVAGHEIEGSPEYSRAPRCFGSMRRAAS